MRIQNNMMALNTYRQYNIANNQTAGYAEKLSSGYQINRAGDDAAGLAISEKMRAQIRGLNMASKNSLDAVSLIQTAEGALQSTHDILQRMRELAVQSASDTNEQVIDRGALDQEFQALKEEIDDIASTTRFNDQNLIDGTFQKAFYSTNISASKLTSQTVADVNRVGVKSNHNMDGIYKIGVQYIESTKTVYARASEVDTQVSGENRILLSKDATAGSGIESIINRVDFDAVVGAEHNGKTFTISASGEGYDLFDDNDGLKVTMTDGDTVYEGTIVSTSSMKGGAEVTINFTGVGTMTLYLDEDIEDIDQKVSNIASALNTKQIKFIQAHEAELDGGTHEVSPTDPYVANITAPVTGVTADNSTITKEADSITLNAGAVALDATANSLAFAAAGDSVTATIDGATVTGSLTITSQTGVTVAGGTVTGPGSVTVELDLGDYGTYEFTVNASVGAASGAGFQNALVAALGAFTASTTIAPPAYSIETTFDASSAQSGATRTELTVSDNTVAVAYPPATAGDPIVDLSAVEFEIILEDGNTVTFTNNNATANWPTTTTGTLTGSFSFSEIYAPNGIEGELNYRITLDGYGSFDIHIGAQEGRQATDLQTEIASALNNLTQKLGDLNEGVDSVKGTAAQIALTLNGEVQILEENDTKATFDNSGVSLSFRPLDFSNVTNTATATAKFTTNNTLTDTIEIHVTENAGKALTIQTGANQGDELDINIDAMNLQLLGLSDSNISTQKNAARAITEVNNAINQVSTQRAALGALQNRLNFKIANLDTSAENLQAAESRIRDTDMAKVMTAFTKSNILGQAATAMLAQANSQPQNVLQLLR